MPSKPIPLKVAAAHRYVARRFRDNPTLREVADAAGISPFYLLRQFRRYYGKTPKQLATELQVGEVQRLILAGREMREVFRQVGFSTQTYLSARFKQVVGKTARVWLREQRKG